MLPVATEEVESFAIVEFELSTALLTVAVGGVALTDGPLVMPTDKLVPPNDSSPAKYCCFAGLLVKTTCPTPSFAQLHNVTLDVAEFRPILHTFGKVS